jgi:hypothetical protein
MRGKREHIQLYLRVAMEWAKGRQRKELASDFAIGRQRAEEIVGRMIRESDAIFGRGPHKSRHLHPDHRDEYQRRFTEMAKQEGIEL